MVVLQVFTENVKIKYKSTILSKATFFTVLTGIISLIVPYIIACKTEGFWIDRIIFHEQPKVDFRGEYLFAAFTDNMSHPIVCSSFNHFKGNNLDTCVYFKFREMDNNDDGKADQLDFVMRINLFNLHITSLVFILPINYEIKTCPIRMQSAIIFQHYFHENTVTEFKVIADLGFSQRSVLNCDEDTYNFYNYPLLNSKLEEGRFEVGDIVENYLGRNLTTWLVNTFTQPKSENKDVFNIKLSVRYPEHSFYIMPGIWYKIKQAWIQYLAIFVVVNWVLNYIRAYMYHKKWLLFFIESPINKKM